MSAQNARTAHPANAPLQGERRTASRRLLRCRVALTLGEKETLHGFSVDMSKGGLRICVPRKVAVHQECTVALNALIEGKVYKIEALGEVTSCICSGMDGFQLGIKFVHLGNESAQALEQLFG